MHSDTPPSWSIIDPGSPHPHTHSQSINYWFLISAYGSLVKFRKFLRKSFEMVANVPNWNPERLYSKLNLEFWILFKIRQIQTCEHGKPLRATSFTFLECSKVNSRVSKIILNLKTLQLRDFELLARTERTSKKIEMFCFFSQNSIRRRPLAFAALESRDSKKTKKKKLRIKF